MLRQFLRCFPEITCIKHGPRAFKVNKICYGRGYSTKPRMSYGEYCVNAVKRWDYENYLCALLLPEAVRTSVFAIRAFNVEVSQIEDTVSQKTIGLMRIQFWKDALEKIYQGNPPKSPVTICLEKAVQRHNLSKSWLSRVIQAREEMLENVHGFSTITEAENYAENTTSAINYLTLECLGIRNVHADHAASHMGKAQGLVTLLRATPYHASKRRVYLPTNFLIKHKVSQEEIFRGSREQKVKDVIYDVASSAHIHLTKARSMKKDLPKQTHMAFLSSVSTEMFLTAVQKADFDIFHPSLQQRNHMLPWKLWVQKFKKTY